MVIGNGLMAKSFSKYDNHRSILIFASGVSNSIELNKKEFDREKKLIERTLRDFPNHLFVYFSTYSIYDEAVNDRPYVVHKIAMEDIIKKRSNAYLILRVSNVVGTNGNSNTIMNFLVNAIQHGSFFELWEHSERNFIDQDDLKKISDRLITSGARNEVINVGYKYNVRVKDVVTLIEEHLNKKGNYSIINKGSSLELNIERISGYFDESKLSTDNGIHYVQSLLKKYY